MTYYLPPEPVQEAKNASGGGYHSDGRLLVVFLKEKDSPPKLLRNQARLPQHPLSYKCLMASPRSKANNSGNTALMEAPNGERERVFDAFRHWGYLEADLDPLGFLQPVPHPDLQLDGEYAQEARQIYCGTIGAEFMHIADPACRRWIQDKLEGPQEPVDQQRTLDLLTRAEFFELVRSSVTLAASAFHSKA